MKKTIVFILISLALLSLSCLSPQPANASALSDLANSLQPGEWRELVTNNFSGGQILAAGNGSILEYTDEAQWDPVGKKLYIIGTALPYGIANQKWLEYSEAANSWQGLTNYSYIGPHAYDHVALDPSRRQYYVREAYTSSVHRYNFATGQWTQIPDMPGALTSSECCGALEYFPEIDRVIYVGTSESIHYLFNPSTNSWSAQAWGITGGGYDIHNISEYDPVNGVLYFGGGNYHPYDFFKLERSGKVSKLASPPVPLGINGYSTNHTVDPVSGKFLVFKPGGTTYEYDPSSNSWRTTGTHPLGSGAQQFAVTAKIPEYGVIIGVSHTVGKVFLYKHSSGTPPPPDTTPPSAPTGLTATAVSSSQINLAWTASTDNVGVTGYRIERCQGSSCTNFSQISTPTAPSYNDTGLSANTAYRYQVRAQDAAGNLSNYSSIVSAITQASSSPPSDFTTRCAAAGVVRCFGFDTASDFNIGSGGIIGAYGQNFGILPPSGTSDYTRATQDTTQKASGASSLKFTIPSNSGSDTSGSWFTNFSTNLATQFGENSEFYVQWRQRFSPEMIRVWLQADGGMTGWKQIIVGEGDQVSQPTVPSCTELELVMYQDGRYLGPAFYHSCAHYLGLQFYDGVQVRLQHQGPPYCYYPNDPQSGCFRHAANEWMTFQVRVQIGTWNTPSSRLQVWAAREGQPSVMIYDTNISDPGGYILYNSSSSGAKYGKLWLLPYMTNKDSSEVHPTAYTWYDELIISRNKIADPILPSTLIGDANCDGNVDILDIQTLVNYILGLTQDICDSNPDWPILPIDVLDVQEAVNIILGV